MILNLIGGSLYEKLEYLDDVQISSGVKIVEALAHILDLKERSPRVDVPKPGIMAVAAMFTDLKLRGRYFVGRCLLHPKQHPSLPSILNEGNGNGRWHCFHKGRGVDSISLYARVKGISYHQALDELTTGVEP